MPTSRLFPPLPKELPVVDFACIRKRSFQDDSSDLSDLPDSPTSSETIRTTRSTRHRSKRIRIQGPTPSSTKSGDHHSPLYETPDETSFALPQVAIDALCATINETFPWASFAAEHNLDPTTLRTHINQQILFPILSTSSPSSPYHELVARAENYRIVRRAIAARLTTAELDEARELRDYEKMRDKERWQARKQEFRAELEELESGWRGSMRQLGVVREGMKEGWRGEKARRREEKLGRKGEWKRKERGIEERASASCV